MKKAMKIFSILMMAVMMIMVATPVFAAVDPSSAISGITPEYSGNNDFVDKMGKIIGFLQWAGAIAGVLIIAIFGVKYMMGSLEEKAEYKKTMIPFIIGAVVLFAAPQIAKLIFSILT
mgnify:FL=1